MKIFIEDQRFDQWWVRIMVAIVSVIIIGTLIFTFPDMYAQSPSTFWATVVISTISLLILFSLLFLLKLETKIDELGIHYAFWPIHLHAKTVKWSVMGNCYVRKYSPIGEFGGWGYRINPFRKAKALNVKGNMGIQIVFKDGKQLLLGTQKPEEAQRVINNYKLH